MTEKEKFAPVRGVIFDLDGTLAYTMEDLKSAMNYMLRFYGFPERTTEQLLAAINHGGRVFVKRSLPPEKAEDESFLDEAYAVYHEHYLSDPVEKTVLYDGFDKVFGLLEKRGIVSAVCTNKETDVAKRIAAKLFPGKASLVVGGEKRFRSKPAPDGVNYICSELGLDPATILYVGDSGVDMHTARNAGVRAVWCSWGYAKRDAFPEIEPDFIASVPTDICDIIEKCSG